MTTKTDNYRETLEKWRQGVHLDGCHSAAMLLIKERDTLARENERLREQIEEVRAIIATARGRQYLGEITVDVLLKHHSQDVKAIDAALANAPTPTDKGNK